MSEKCPSQAHVLNTSFQLAAVFGEIMKLLGVADLTEEICP